jgi:hypothetical protein
MAFETGYYVLAPGEPMTISVSWGGAYMGPQFVLAAPYYFTYERWRFITSEHGVSRDGDSWAYWVTVTNVGSTNAAFKLIGGGVT